MLCVSQRLAMCWQKTKCVVCSICNQMSCLSQQAHMFAPCKPCSSAMRCSAKCCYSQKPHVSDHPAYDVSAVHLMHITMPCARA